jgi:hypothetical protein
MTDARGAVAHLRIENKVCVRLRRPRSRYSSDTRNLGQDDRCKRCRGPLKDCHLLYCCTRRQHSVLCALSFVAAGNSFKYGTLAASCGNSLFRDRELKNDNCTINNTIFLSRACKLQLALGSFIILTRQPLGSVFVWCVFSRALKHLRLSCVLMSKNAY